MMEHPWRTWFDDIAAGRLSPAEAAERAAAWRAGGDLGFARLDLERAARTGAPEVVYAAGKTPDQTEAILARLLERAPAALATRVPPETAERLRARWPDARWFAAARLCVVGTPPPPAPERGPVLVVCAGTSDLPVAEEALETARFLGLDARLVVDVGVAGLHRLLARTDDLRAARAVIAVAGMEGALASVVAGLTPAPVIAVPTSVGYGAALGGLAALLAMLTSCSAGVAVVNIDNGFGAASLAARMLPRPAS